MRKLWFAAYKEIKLLSRDLGGLIILFAMPIALILTISLIQDSSFKILKNNKVPILLVDDDKGEIAATVISQLRDSSAFELVTILGDKPLTETDAKDAVLRGDYQMAVVIPKDLSRNIYQVIDRNVQVILRDFGVGDSLIGKKPVTRPKEIKLFFDPATQQTFKSMVLLQIDNMISKIETETIYAAFYDVLGEEGLTENPFTADRNMVQFKEINPGSQEAVIIPTSTQHNVPAWTLFAIFFIVIPLSINMVKEKNLGTFIRLRTQPVSYLTVLGGKAITYLAVCFIQFVILLIIGKYLLPYLGLPSFTIGDNFIKMSLVAIFSGLAAIGFGILLGTIATTPEQSAPFGATAAVILAAIGGVWVPVFMMPDFMQIISKISPMNWGLQAFYDVLLRQATTLDILPKLGLLLLFFVVNVIIALWYNKKQITV
ncbi:MAG: ABC transporter [Flavobacteriales bacterium]|nr:MAG: ABC transporter [Flavobacteriales bacterium]